MSSSSSSDDHFSRLDTNHDGFVSRDEARSDPALTRDWSKIDTDHDNKISRSEFDAHSSSAAGATTGSVPSGTAGSERAPRSDRN
jgi:EF hand domain-containing protein